MIPLYIDDDSAATALMSELRRLRLDSVSSDAAGLRGAPDPAHLEYAATVHRALVTANGADFIRLHWEWLGTARHHSGIIIASQAIPLGERIRRLVEVSRLGRPGDLDDRLLLLTQWR